LITDAKMNAQESDAPLSGVVVVENGKGVAASYTGRILALMGATVIKLESPGAGDALRQVGPRLHASAQMGAIFAYLNINKASVTLDLGTAQGQQILGELLDRASVFIDDTHPAARRTQGLAPADVCATRPRLIYVSVLPFGAVGPHSEYRAYELNDFHAGGEGYLMPNGLALEMFPERPPVKIYGHFAEFNGGTSAACATLAALLVQDEEGGQFVDVSVQDINVALSSFSLQRLGEGVLENRHERSFQYGGVLECKDGYVQVLTLEQHQWEGLVELMGSPAWSQEAALKDPLVRGRRGKEINQHLRAWAKTQAVEDLVRRGQALSVPLAKYADPAEILASAQTRERAMFGVFEIGNNEVPVLAAPFQSSRSKKLKSYPEQPGADNARLLCDWLGHSPSEFVRDTRAAAV
jgi:crotonobetainyl-CoA:carnitine CoA-transferase CaiB-like acyl-CoA transferase